MTTSFAVREGMELLSWDYFPALWQKHVENESKRCDPLKPGAVVTGLVAWLLYGLTLWAAFHWVSYVPIFAFVVAGAAFLIARAARQAPNVVPSQPPHVTFTSTGVCFGESAWLWRGDDHWLDTFSPPRVVPGAGGSSPHVLELTFVRTWRALKTVRIPVPTHLLGDARGLARDLRSRLAGRFPTISPGVATSARNCR